MYQVVAISPLPFGWAWPEDAAEALIPVQEVMASDGAARSGYVCRFSVCAHQRAACHLSFCGYPDRRYRRTLVRGGS